MRRLWGCYRSCAVLVFTAQIITALVIVGIVVGTGFIQLPVLSDLVRANTGRSVAPVDAPNPLPAKWGEALPLAPAVSISFTEVEVNQLLALVESREPTPLKEMRAELFERHMRVHGKLPGPIPIAAQIRGRLEVRSGLLRCAAEDVYAGDLSLPAVLAEPFCAWATQQFHRVLVDNKIPLSVKQVEMRDRSVVITGQLPAGWEPPTIPGGQ